MILTPITLRRKGRGYLFEQLAKTLKARFEKRELPQSPYNSDFVAKIERSRKNYKEEEGTIITLKELNELCK